MSLHPIFTIMPTCRFLKFVPIERDLAYIKSLLWEIKEGDDNTPEEIEEYILDILGKGQWMGRMFRAECKKFNIACVLTESVVISEFTPLAMLVFNQSRLLQCDKREEDKIYPHKTLMSWVLDSLEV